MLIYKTLKPMFDKYDPEEEVIPVGSIIEYENKRRANEAVKNGLVEEVDVIKFAEPKKEEPKTTAKKEPKKKTKK